MDLHLYEIGNGFVGESYARVYVIAGKDEDTKALALDQFEHAWPGAVMEAEISSKVLVKEGFCSLPSDSGLELGD